MKTIRKEFPQVRAYKRNGATYFSVDCRRKGWLGKKRIGFSDKFEALAKAREIAEKVASEGFDGANSVSAVTTDKNLRQWADQLAPFGKTLADAVGHYLEWLKEQARNQQVPHLKGLFAEWRNFKQADKTKHLRPRTLTEVRTFSRRFEKDWGHLRVNELSRLTIEEFLNGMRNRKGSNASVHARKKYLSMLSQFLNWCVSREVLKDNPARTLRIPALHEIPRIYSVDQCERILRLAEEARHRALLPYVTIGLFAGVRPSELGRLSWSNLSKTDVLIEPHQSKVKRARHAKISPTLERWLAIADRGQPLAPRNLTRRLKAFSAEVGFWIQDGLRHSYATYWLAVHRNRNELAEFMGNTPEVIGKHYLRPVTDEDAAKFWTLAPSHQTAAPESTGKAG
jgi:integrase/recombinase XerD